MLHAPQLRHERFFYMPLATQALVILFKQVHCKVIIGRNPIEANANTVAIQLPGNPVAYIGKCFTPYQEFLQPLQVNYHLLANYPQKLKQFPVQAKGFADRSVKYLYYTYNLPIYIYSVVQNGQIATMQCPLRGPALSMHIVNFPQPVCTNFM